MVLKRFYDEKLAQASYLVGCAKTGESIVIDPNRDTSQYLDAAAAEGLKVTAVTETHIHADFLSGSRELAERAGAKLYLSDEGGPDWRYDFRDQPNVVLVKDGDVITVGNLKFDVLHTPGHTPEHITFVLTDTPTSPTPVGAFTGDFIFVGDVGRPDLLEKAAGVAGAMAEGADALYASLQKFSGSMADTLLIWPGHGAGSACGKNLGSVPVSVLGYERQANWGLRFGSAASFVAAVLEGQPEPPNYFAMMKKLNKQGPAILGEFKPRPLVPVGEMRDLLDTGMNLIDLRPHSELQKGFLPGSISIPMGKGLVTWAGWLVSYDQPIYFIATQQEEVNQAAKDLALIGLDDVRGWVQSDSIGELGVLEQVPTMDPIELVQKMRTGDVSVLDIRGAGEYKMGHIPSVPNINLGHLVSKVALIPQDKTLVLQCASGFRSIVGATVLRKLGFKNVVSLAGGFSAYAWAGLPTEVGN